MFFKRLPFLAALAIGGQLALTFAGTAKMPEAVPNTFSGAFLAGQTAQADGDLDGTVAFFEKALAFQPDDDRLRETLMLALVARGDFDAALPHAERLKTVAESERFSRLALGVDALRNGRFKDSRNWLKLALESDLDILITRVMVAWAWAGEGDEVEALKVIDGLEGPEWYALFKNYHRGLIAEFGGLAGEAEESLRKAAADVATGAATPDVYLRAVEAWARFLARKGDKAEALAVLDRAEDFPVSRQMFKALRERIEAGGKEPPLFAEAREGAAEILQNIGAALNREGGETFVKPYLQLALALDPGNDAALMQLAQAAERQQEAEEAVGFYDRVPADSGLKRIANLQQALNQADLDRTKEAVDRIEALITEDPDDIRAYLSLSSVHAAKENYAASAAALDRAIARIPAPTRNDWNVFYQRGIAFERTKQWPKAEADFHKALELYPDQPQVLNYLGYSWIDMGINLDKGLDLIRKAVDQRPDDGFIVDSLGWAYFKLGRIEDAVREMERAVSLKPDDPILNDHLGDVYWYAGRRREAVFQWNHARDMKPEAAILATIEKKLREGLPDTPVKKVENGNTAGQSKNGG